MTVRYNNEQGWARFDDLLSPERARSVSTACLGMLDGPEHALHPNDKPHGGTRRLFDVMARAPEVADIPAMVEPVIDQILPSPYRLAGATFRCPQPGFGGQRLHTDAMVQTGEIGPADTATVVVALVPFTEQNGATRLIPGSHRRPDLQRRAGTLEHHRDEIRLTGPAGVGFVFSGHVLHSGMENTSSEPRPALQLLFTTGVQPGTGW